MKIILLISFSLIVLNLKLVSTQESKVTKVKHIIIDSPKVTLQDSKSLTSNKIHKQILADKILLEEMKTLIRNCLGANRAYLNVEFQALQPGKCTRSANLRVDLQSSKAGKRDTFVVKINDESKMLKPNIGEETVCALAIEKPSINRFYYAYPTNKVQYAGKLNF